MKRTIKGSITQGIAKYCEQFQSTMKGKKWKDIFEILSGIIRVKSCLLTKIVEQTCKYQESWSDRSNKNVKKLKKNHQITRISNHLAETIDELKEAYLKKVSREFLKSGEKVKDIWPKADTMKVKEVVKNVLKIAHDGSDIAKPYAKKMEGREIVRDGSKSSKTKCIRGPGYSTFGSMGISKKRYWMFNHELYSQKKEPEYAEHLYAEKKNLKILKNHNLLNQIVNLYDREYDDAKWFNSLVNQSAYFIIRGKEKRNIAYAKDLEKIETCKMEKERKKFFIPLKELEEEMKFGEHPEFLSTPEKKSYQVGFSKIVVKNRVYKSKKPKIQYQYIPLNLVIIKLPKTKKLEEDIESGRNEGKIYLYTNLSVNNIHQAMIIFFLYLDRWAIEVYFRFIKQSYDLEQVRMQQYEKIKNMVHYVAIASDYDYEKFGEYMVEKDQKLEKKEKEKEKEKEKAFRKTMKKLITPKKKRRTFLEIERDEIQDKYHTFLSYKGLYANVSSFSGCMKEYFRPQIPYTTDIELKNKLQIDDMNTMDKIDKEKYFIQINYKLFLEFKGLKENPSSFASFIKDYSHLSIPFGRIKCRSP